MSFTLSLPPPPTFTASAGSDITSDDVSHTPFVVTTSSDDDEVTLPLMLPTVPPAQTVLDIDAIPEYNTTLGDTTSPKTLTLLPGQDDHVQRIESALLEYDRAFDVSETGKGKTYSTCYIALKNDWKLFVVGPKTVNTMKWDVVPFEYGIKAVVYSYGTSRNGFQGLLSVTKDGKRSEFEATDDLRQMVDERTLLVFDESHHLKNPGTTQLAACGELSKTVIEAGGRILCLSATPLEDPKHTPSMFKTLGIMTRDTPYVYDFSSKQYNPTGILEIEEFASTIDDDKLEEIKPAVIHRSNRNKYVRDILYEIVLPAIRSEIIRDVHEDSKDLKNLFMRLDTESMESLVGHIEALNMITQQQKEAGTPGANFGQVTTMLRQIECAKVPLFIKAIDKALASPDAKVVMGINFQKTMWKLSDYFMSHPELYFVEDEDGDEVPIYEFMTGDHSQAERETTLDDFRNDPNLRVLIVSPKVGGEGIDLHAIDGKTQIYEFASPSYNHTEMIQFLGRAHRAGQTSVPVIRIIYVDDQEGKIQRELKIMDALNSKSENMAEAKGLKLEDCQMPGSLPPEYEADFLNN